MDATANPHAMCDSLIHWLHTLRLQAPHRNAPELSDGVAMAQALHQIAPDHFPASWLAKIKFEVGSNWRLKVSNLKKVSAGALDYYADCLQLPAGDCRRPPDVLAIAETHDSGELAALLQLVLGCAVNSPRKQDYITEIMGLEEELQRNIMTALQELETVWLGGGANTPTGARGAVTSSTAAAGSPFGAGLAGAAKGGASAGIQSAASSDVLAQRCHEAERRCALLLDEKFTLQQEVNKMQEELDRCGAGGPMAAGGEAATAQVRIGDDGVSLGPVQPGSTRYTELRRQLDAMKDELLTAETQRDDFKIRCAQQEREMVALHQRVDEMNKTADELVAVRDEVDALRDAADRLKVCEAQLVTFKKKLEDQHDLRRQVKQLELANGELQQQAQLQDEHMKKGAALRGQLELCKTEIEELHGKLDAEMMKAVKTEFELSNVAARGAALLRENKSLLVERDQLRDSCDELRCAVQMGQIGRGGGGGGVGGGGGGGGEGERRTDMSRELSGADRERPSVGQRISAETVVSDEHKAFLAQFMDESNQRIEKLRDQLKNANQKILFFEAQSGIDSRDAKDSQDTLLQQLKQALEQNERKAAQLDEAHVSIAQHASKIGQLEAALGARDQELSAADARYRKSVEKTKEIIQSGFTDFSLSPASNASPDKADRTAAGGADTDNNNPAAGEPARPPIDSVEERLMATAYYRLSVACHRDAMEARLALLNGAGQSFLNRQRQPAARKALPNSGTSGVGGGSSGSAR